jgi:hypothetical protein
MAGTPVPLRFGSSASGGYTPCGFEGEGRMAGDIPDIDPGDGGGVDETAKKKGGHKLAPTGERCLACDAEIVGPYCAACGQKNDDMRRSTLILFKDFIEDTFSFDSRMWTTLGLMAAAPGRVPTNYSHGQRSRYTPPVRLFLVISFLFFLVLGLTKTMLVAIEVTAKTPEEIAAAKADYADALEKMDDKTRALVESASASNEAIVIDGKDVKCNINVKARFFVRPQDISIDQEKWRECAQSVSEAAKVEIDAPETKVQGEIGDAALTKEDIKTGFDRIVSGLDMLVSDPVSFNESVNLWLPRVMFFMAPILALILALFIRGRGALFFDHLVLSLYSHATGFAIFGAAIMLGQFGVPQMLPASILALGLYFTLALKRAYGRGWVKTVWTSAMAGFVYFVILVGIVMAIVGEKIWAAAA